MKIFILLLLLTTSVSAQSIDTFTQSAEAVHGAEGLRAVDLTPKMLTPIPVLNKRDTATAIQHTYERQLKESREKREKELNAKQIQLGDKTLRWKERTFGKEPSSGHSLWISMHGGGNAPSELNDQQWENQIQLYEPDEGIYIAPRAPTDTWNLWHEAHIDPMFQQLIEDYVALRNVDPNRIYLMGYSAGGDGVWQLAPRMADRFAAASMMAGHPNEASVIGLRNLPFAAFVGAEDSGYNRNQIVAEKGEELDQLHKEDSDGYIHLTRIYEGLGHWMNQKDQEALDWMQKFTRNPWPEKIVWLQGDILHDRFYWLKIPKEAAKKDQKIIASVSGQTITLEGDIPEGLRIRLSDQLIDLDRPVTVIMNGEKCFSAKVHRETCVIQQTLAERLDPASAACAEILIPLRSTYGTIYGVKVPGYTHRDQGPRLHS